MYNLNLFLEYILEKFNILIRRKKIYKFLTFVDKKNEKDKIVEAFEIKEYSKRRAYKTANEMLTLKYPDSGLDIRFV